MPGRILKSLLVSLVVTLFGSLMGAVVMLFAAGVWARTESASFGAYAIVLSGWQAMLFPAALFLAVFIYVYRRMGKTVPSRME